MMLGKRFNHRIGIIGCGIIGATIAYELSLVPGLEVTLFERRSPASGATGAALGVLMGAISTKTRGRAWQLRQASIKRYQTLIPELETLTGTEIPRNDQGIVLLCFEEKWWEKWGKILEIRRNQGWELRKWSLAQLKDSCPQIESDRLIGAIYSPGDRQINPTELTKVLVAGAGKNGVNCQFDITVEKIESVIDSQSQLNRVYALETSAQSYELDWLVIAAGLGSIPLIRPLSPTVEMSPILGQAMEIQLPQRLGKSDFQPVITGHDTHIVPLGNNQYWLGATVEFPHSSKVPLPDTQKLEKLKSQAIEFCPKLAEASMIRTWSGYRPRPQGRPAPIIETLVGYQNVILATGHYRNGILLAPATAAAAREMMVNHGR